MDPLPDDVRQFLAANIDSVEQLEILRILGIEPARSWPAAELLPLVQTAPEALQGHLTALESRGLILCQRSGELAVQYGPRTPEAAAQVRRLLEFYQQRPVTMIRLVYERPPDALRKFSDAFKFKKED